MNKQDVLNLNIGLEYSTKLEKHLYQNFIINPNNRLTAKELELVIDTIQRLKHFNYLARKAEAS